MNIFKQIRKSILFCFLTILPLASSAASPTFEARLKLDFGGDPECKLVNIATGKEVVAGRGNLVHDEDSISWTSTCVISLPKSVTYCTLASQELSGPDMFTFIQSGFQKKVLRAKVVSESDINQGFGSFITNYLCFE